MPKTLSLTAHSEGVIICVAVKAAARRNAVLDVHDGRVKVCVTAAPEKGKANQAILALLAETLAISARQLEIIAGETQTKKKILIRQMSAETLQEKLAAHLG